MKILKIYLQNLNSLKGEFTIDFEKAPLKNAGLFLISGKTGAGKTTILDAITLALYGDAPRFDDVKGKQAAEMMTHGTSESAAELTFSTASGVFVSKWRMRRTRTGNLEKTAKRELYQILPDGETPILAKKVTEVNQAVEELLGGLNFNRFKRSIMLAQGDFAQFLRGTEDRSDILERITDTALYSEISKHAHLRHKEEEDKYNQLAQKLSHTQLLDKEELAELKTKQSEKEAQSKSYRTDLDRYTKAIQWYEKEAQLNKEKETTQNQLVSLELEKNNLASEIKKLELHLQAVPLKSELQELYRQQTSLGQLNSEIEELEVEQVKLKAELLEKTDRLSIKQAASKTTELNITTQEPIWDKVKSLDLDIETQIKASEQINLELEQLREKSSLKNKEINALQSNIKKLNPTIEELNLWVSSNKIDPRILDNSLFVSLSSYNKEQELLAKRTQERHLELDNTQTRYREKEKALEDAKQDSIKHNTATEKALKEMDIQIQNFDPSLVDASLEDVLFELNSQLEDLSEQQLALTQLDNILNNRVEILDKLEEISENKLSIETALESIDYYSLQLYEQKVLLEEEIEYQNSLCETLQYNISLEEHRVLLKADCDCPLCGSKEHPYIKAGLNKDLFDSKFAKEKQKLVKLQDARKEKEDEFWKQQNNANEIDRSKKLLEKESDLYQSLWLEMETNAIKLFRNHPQLAEEAIEYSDLELTTEKEMTKSKFDRFSAIKTALEKSSRAISSLTEKQLYAKKMISLLHIDLDQVKAELTTQESQLQLVAKEKDRLLQKLNTALEGIYPNLAKIEDLPKTIMKLEKSKAEFQKKQNSLREKEKEKKEFEMQLNTQASLMEQLDLQISTANNKKKNITQSLAVIQSERTQLFDDKDVHLERQKLKQSFSTLQKEVESLKSATHQCEANLQTSNQLLADKQKRSQLLIKEIEMQLSELNTQSQERGFSDLMTLRNAILPKDTVERISKKWSILEKSIEKQIADLKIFEKKIELHHQVKSESSPLEVLRDLKEEAEQGKDSTLEEIGKLKQILEEQENIKQTQKVLLNQIQNQKKELRRWKQLYELIGHAEGKKFRQFAQNITLNKLIHLANKHLRQFVSGRYLLEKRAEDSLEIDIIDTYQANNKRPLNTLSGGETFLASLSLALGLSDLAGGRAQIESLFIDEGFGTLDQETLQLALRALHVLQSQGKTIGIISHVPQLQESIEVQIKVEKRSGGNSLIKY